MEERTLAIIKPDAVERHIVGQIVGMAEEKKLSMVAAKMVHLTKKEAEGFYYVHRDKNFFESLTQYMSEGPIFVLVLQGKEAINRWREIMGATDPSKAEEGTIRKRFGKSIERNAVHGSDGPESARFEISYFFSALEFTADDTTDS
ncbi:MAG: nucleoside-diphosphate kinase [Acidobacteriota bacterium]